ncbi:MAG: phosphoribosylamine--glycine ligase [Pyrinomonadaceae bacterium]|nr:phosphoribosylamine--glycine ligase [Pyrinomonadaceae bacterium]
MKILVIGSGGREHAIIWAIKRSARTTEVFCANGNGGIAEIAECVDISPTDIGALSDFAFEKEIDLTFVGGENSLALGIVDDFERKGLRVIGASQKAARLESSKAFAKDFMARHDIPTAAYRVAGSSEEAIEYLHEGVFGDEGSPVVVKADGLAAGKGVVVANDRAEAVSAIESMVSGELIDARAADTIVLEECLVGNEVSVLMFADGEHFALMPATRDHKRIGEGDTGANTGGMGTITDPNLLSKEQTATIIDKIIKPTIEGAKAEDYPFKGILFLGLMMTESGPRVLEYNVRFGDPETQAILVNLETDFIDICESIENGKLDKLLIEWKEGSSACVILAAENYPKSPKSGDIIKGIETASRREDTVVFHAGTELNENGRFITSGGRVLAVTATASRLSNALHRAYKAVNDISWDGMQFRRDIGRTSGIK